MLTLEFTEYDDENADIDKMGTRIPSEAQPQAEGSESETLEIWVNLRSHIGHLNGMRWHFNTKSGALMDAEAATRIKGFRITSNGQ